MQVAGRQSTLKSREQRRNVVLQARIRDDFGWRDACILNLSSRGLLAHSASSAAPGTYVELHRGETVIVARVVWRQDRQIGLCSQDRLQVEQILNGIKAELQLGAPGTQIERRRRACDHDKSRTRARFGEFASILLFGVVLASLAYTMVAEALAEPIARVSSALHGR